MGQIAEHAIDQLKEKATALLESWDNELAQHTRELVKKGAWPFETVSSEYFLNVVQPFMNAIHEIEDAEEQDFEGIHIGTLQDKIAYTSMDVIQCIQKMELETTLQMVIENSSSPNKMYSDKCRNMCSIWEWAQDELYANNNYAIDMLLPTYKEAQRLPLRICDASEWDFTVPEAIMYTEKTIQEYEEIFAAAAKCSQELLDYGTPSETAMGQLTDKIMKEWEHIKAQNLMLLGALAEQELQIDYINTFVMHSLRKQAMCFLAMDTIQKEKDTPQTADLRNVYEHYMDGIKQINDLIKEMRIKEAQMLPETTLTISKVGDGTYAITVSQSSGVKAQTKKTENGVENTYTAEKKRYEHTRITKIGKKSHAFKMEKHIKRAVLLSAKEESVSKTEKADEKTRAIKETVLGEFSMTTTRTSKSYGKRTVRLDLKASGLKHKRRKVKLRQVGPKTEEKQIAGVSVEVLGASGSVSAPTKDCLGTYLVSVNASPAKADANYHGINVAVAAGVGASVGCQLTVDDIIKSASKTLAEELMNGSAANFTRVIDSVTALLKDAAPDTQTNWGSIKISASDLTLFQAQVSENQETQEMQIEAGSPVIDELQDLSDSAYEILDALKEKEQEQQKILVGTDDSPHFEVECFEDYDYDLVL